MTETENRPLVSRETLQQSFGLKGFTGRILSGMIYGILGMRKVNRCYASLPKAEGPAFSKQVLEALDIKFEIPEEQLRYIPEEGGFITVSNHHYGAVDGMILNAVIGSMRPDYRILTTFILAKIENLQNDFIPVDNFASGAARSVSGIKEALGHIEAGKPLGLFPAGEVATWQKKKDRTSVQGCRVVEDKPWAENMMKLVLKSGLPVIPIWFDGGNSRLFHILGRIHPIFRTLRLAREMMGAKGKTIRVRIGQPIPSAQLAGFDTGTLGKYLRNRCYALEGQLHKESTHLSGDAPQQPIADPVDPEIIRSQIDAIEDRLIFETGGYRAYLILAEEAPDVMRELYRLREVTFRAVGEGTGKALDTDFYDSYYHHLILWNVENRELVGAYRVGYGTEIIAAHGGVPGFYTSTLINFGPDAEVILAHSMELGRSFIREKYQREVLTLKLLLAGLCVATTKDPNVDCCVGLVTMSAAMPDFYKSLAVHFLYKHFMLPNAERFATPTTPFKPRLLRVNPDELLQVPDGDIDAFDRLLGTVSDGAYRLPVLFRKYFSCGAKVSCVNVDPDFSDCVDAMIVLKLRDFPAMSIKSFVRSLPEEVQKKVFLHFYGTEDV